jgi:dipeptidyl aminopeptidase/acylaminoacyl peptidase
MADGNGFWYADGPANSTVIYRVDPVSNRKIELFDVTRLREVLRSFTGEEPPYRGVPFRALEFVQWEQAVRFRVGERDLVLDLTTYEVVKAPEIERTDYGPGPGEYPSPDGRWVAFNRDFNVWVRSQVDGGEHQITQDGVEYAAWRIPHAGAWSPDGSRMAVTKAEVRTCPKTPIARWLGENPDLSWTVDCGPDPSLSGEAHELGVITVETGEFNRADLGNLPHDWGIVVIGWHPDGSRVLSRFWESSKKLHLAVTDPDTGRSWLLQSRHPVEWLSARGAAGRRWILQDGTGILVLHEEDEWMHVHLFDWEGQRVREITSVPFDVFRIVRVDEDCEWIYFTAQGDEGRPYDAHLYRVRLDGSGLTRLTEGVGNHDGPMLWSDQRTEIQFSPSGEFFLDTYSTVNRAPVVELRQADGTLLQTLSTGSFEGLASELKWTQPEEFVVKADDGQSDLHGVLLKPFDFDPAQEYPVLQLVYGGSEVPNDFNLSGPLGLQAQGLAQLGFVVVMLRPRGSEGRGKTFREAFSGGSRQRGMMVDYAAALKQLAQVRPYLDLSRVGVYGYSGGGPLALWAMLAFPDVYHVGIAGAPLREDALLELAGELRGKLLLILGTADTRGGILPMTMRMINALIEAGKPYDLMIMPDEGHGIGTRPASRPHFGKTLAWYFGEHLEPPTWREQPSGM